MKIETRIGVTIPLAIIALTLPFLIRSPNPIKKRIMLAGTLIQICGAGINFLAVARNGGKMPSIASCDGKPCICHESMPKDKMKYPWLCDVIDIGFAYASIGDVLLTVGMLLAISNLLI